MSDEHKAALAEGRAQGRAVRRYLEALEANRPKRGRKRTPESIKKRLDTHRDRDRHGRPAEAALHLVQERIDLQAELEASEQDVDLAELEEDFVDGRQALQRAQGHHLRRVARGWASPAGVLKQAGIAPG